MSTSRVSYNSNEIVLEHPFHYIPCTPYSTDPPQQIMQIDRIPLGFYILHFLHRQKDYAAVPRPLEIGIEERKTENLDLRPAASSVINWNIVVEVRSIKDSEVISPRACRHFTLVIILWRHPSNISETGTCMMNDIDSTGWMRSSQQQDWRNDVR